MKNRIVTTCFITLTILFSTIITVHGATTYRTGSEILADYNNLESNYPNLIDHVKVGETVNGQNLNLYRIGNPYGARVYVDAAIHGMELVTAEALYYSIESIVSASNGELQDILQENYLLILPIVNLDTYGQPYPTGRYNINGVDLNRQFNYNWIPTNTSGPHPLSEPESQAVDYVFCEYKPIWYMNIHSGWERVTPSRAANTTEKDYMKTVYDEYINILEDNWDYSSLPWSLETGTGAMLASDEGYSMGAKTFEIELCNDHKPTYSLTKTRYARQLIALITSICQDSRIGYTPNPAPLLTPFTITQKTTLPQTLEIGQNYEQTVEIKNIDQCYAYDYMLRLWITNTKANKENQIDGQMFILTFNFVDTSHFSGTVPLGTYAQGTLIGGEIPNEITDPQVIPTVFAEVNYNTTVNFTLTPQSNLLPIGTWTILYEVIDYNPQTQQNINFTQNQLNLDPEQQKNNSWPQRTTEEKEERTRNHFNQNKQNNHYSSQKTTIEIPKKVNRKSTKKH